MKGFIGVALGLLPEALRRSLTAPLHFAFSFDEEVGCLGAPLLLAELARRGVRPSGCIVGEPTSMRPVVAHKGNNAFRCCVTGHAAHSSRTPGGVNAIEYSARLISRIRELADSMRRDGPFDRAFDVPFSTAQTGMISGGIALNTIPENCEFLFEYRNLPSEDPQWLFEQITRYAREELEPESAWLQPRPPSLSKGSARQSHLIAPSRPPSRKWSEPYATTSTLARSLTAPKQGFFRKRAFRRSSAVPAISTRRTRPTNTWNCRNSKNVTAFCGACWIPCPQVK
jgi:acetylornithine deacetylase/succinyl-diaminopimelate desuccinylase-like protein